MIQCYEVIVLVHSLKNIYLTSKGKYSASIQFYTDTSPNQQLNPLISPSMLFKQEFTEQRQFVSGKPEINNQCYISQKVQMKFMDQEVNLFDIIEYKVNTESGNNQQGISLLCKLQKQEGVQNEQIRSVFDAKIKIKSLKQGICEYIQVPFEENHEISLNLCIFSILVGTKLCNEEQVENPMQNFRSVIKQTRYHSFISQQKLSKLCSSDKLKQLSEKRDRSREYFYINKSVSRYQCLELLSVVCSDNYLFYKRFLEVLIVNEITLSELKANHLNQRKQKYTDFVFIRKQSKQGIQSRIKCARKIRKSSNYQSISRKILPIQIQGEFSSAIQYQPVAFYEVIQIMPNLIQNINQTKLTNLYVFCHGFQGSPHDLVLLRNNYKCFDSNAYFLLANSYQQQFDNNLSILEMGEKLSEQILNYMTKQYLNKENTKINFVCFSMGGLIARASLIHLGDMNFGRFTSISTPHLGCAESGTLVQIGLFMLKNVLKYKCIIQLCFSDNKSLEQSLIFKLSQQGSLNAFQQVVIVSNNKDTFVPWQSARVQPIGGKIKGLEDQMIKNIINCNGKLKRIHRIDFDSNQPKSPLYKTKSILEQVVGRAAHVEFIKNDIMIRMMLNTIPLKI